MQASPRFIGVSAALFIGSAALTVAWGGSMSTMHGMPMCSTRMTTPAHDAAAFLLMWTTMMVAMMLPSLMPALHRYRQVVITHTSSRLDALTAIVALAYFFVWGAAGALVYALWVEFAWTASPAAVGVVVFTAGMLQFSRWKARHLACCRSGPQCCDRLSGSARTAWQQGLRLGVHCVHCCAGLTVVLLVLGVMDLRAMLLVTAAISAERLAPDGLRAARWIGGVLLVGGAFLIGHAMA